MGLDYQLVLWNKHKKTYDKIIAFSMLLYVILFAVVTLIFNSETSIETLVIRAFRIASYNNASYNFSDRSISEGEIEFSSNPI